MLPSPVQSRLELAPWMVHRLVRVQSHLRTLAPSPTSVFDHLINSHHLSSNIFSNQEINLTHFLDAEVYVHLLFSSPRAYFLPPLNQQKSFGLQGHTQYSY